MKYSREQENIFGNVAQVLKDFVRIEAVGKEELRRLAAVLKLIPTFFLAVISYVYIFSEAHKQNHVLKILFEI